MTVQPQLATKTRRHEEDQRGRRAFVSRRLARNEWILFAAVAAEVALLALTVDQFLTVRNVFEVARLSVELGLLAVALTPIVVTGGIDLSVGAMLGLSAVVLGAAYLDWHVPIAGAAVLAIDVGCGSG